MQPSIAQSQDLSVLTGSRPKWLLNTLYPLRGHFRDAAPDVPDDKTGMLTGQDGILFHCVDGRVQEARDLHLKPGELYDAGKLGAVIPSPGIKQNKETEALLTRGLVLPKRRHPPRACIIMGHEGCGANHTLMQSYLHPEAVTSRAERRWMQKIAPAQLSHALSEAAGADRAFLHDKVVESSILASMKNALTYHLKVGDHPSHTVEQLAEDGWAHVIGAKRGLTRQEDGKFPLSVFDPARQAFVPIEALYDELFPGNNRRTAEALEERVRQNGFTADATLHVELGVKKPLAEVDEGLAALLNSIRSAGPAQER